MATFDAKTEIRKLPPSVLFKLSQVLDIGNAWQDVMAVIPKDPMDLNSEPKYTIEHMRLIASASEKQSRSCTEILLDEWGTSGKVRPTLSTLLEVLLKAQYYRAAEFVAVELLHGEPPPRPQAGPAAVVDFNLDVGSRSDNSKTLSGDNKLADILHIPYAVLQRVTNDFDETPITFAKGLDQPVGHKLGTGAFGTVYFGQMSNGRRVAVKKLVADAALTLKKQFETEIAMLSEYQHENLVRLLGFSCDTDNYCLVYEFMCNGSLLDRLQMKGVDPDCSGDTNMVLDGMATNVFDGTNTGRGLLDWKRRIAIAVDVTRGIHYLHTSRSTPLIHRDIKTANILLDEELRAKLGDFGLVKIKPNTSESKLLTSTVFGTSAYMAPEAFRGDVSVKMDVFSFGVVLLELLTGLAPYDEERDGCDLVTYIEDVVEDKIDFLLDAKAGSWSLDVAGAVFELSQSCLLEKRKRPFIQEVLERLESLKVDD